MVIVAIGYKYDTTTCNTLFCGGYMSDVDVQSYNTSADTNSVLVPIQIKQR